MVLFLMASIENALHVLQLSGLLELPAEHVFETGLECDLSHILDTVSFIPNNKCTF